MCSCTGSEIYLFLFSSLVIHDSKKDYDYDFHHVMSWTLQLALALECCHLNSIVHRDIKPPKLVKGEGGEHLLYWLYCFDMI